MEEEKQVDITGIPEKKVKKGMPVALRILLYFIATLFTIAVFQVLGLLASGKSLNEASKTGPPDAFTDFMMATFALIPLFFFTFIFRKYIDKKSLVSLGFSAKGRFGDFLLGLGVALTLYILGSGILMLSGNIEFEKHGISFQTIVFNFLTFVSVAIMEEVMVRGYMLNNLMSALNKYVALVISAVIFAAMHSLNPGLSILAMVNLFLAGVLLGAAYIFTKNLWFAMSLHLFWNFIQGPILGYRVSGTITDSFLTATPLGNPIMSGGNFGFEGSIMCSVLCIALAASLFLFYEKKERVQESVL